MHIIIGLLFITGWIVCIRMPTGQKNIFGKPIAPLYQLGYGLWRVFARCVEKTNYVNRLGDRLVVLFPNYKRKKLVEEYICYKLSLVLLILFVANILSGVMVMQENKRNQKVNQLERDSYWGMEKEEVLEVETEELKEEISVTVSEQKYRKEEIPKLLEKEAASLEKIILNKNKSLDCITSDLNLVNQIEGTQIEVGWSMDNDAYIQYDGTLIPGAVTGDGVVVNLTATLSYEGEVFVHSFAVHLQKLKQSLKEAFTEALNREIEVRNTSMAGMEVLELPKEIQGKKVEFRYQQETYGYKLLIGLVVCAVMIFFIKDEYLQKDMENRNKQMIIDYSEVVSKLTLFLGAGLTIRSALEKIAGDYDKKLKQGKCGKRFAYDEILYVCREMQGGVSERMGIDMLGKRCQIPCYMKLCSLLLQNSKKGSKGLAEMLEYEVRQAFEERKTIARCLGEETGTKLLFPMILMLIIVMAVLIIPAFLSF